LIKHISFNELLENKKKYSSNVPSWLKYYFLNWSPAPSQYGCVCYFDNKIIGLMRFNIDNFTLKSKITLVEKKFRNKKIAQNLWTSVIIKYKPKKIAVTIVSKSGARFIKKISQLYPSIEWKID
jgi:hypothetical protein